MNIYETIREYIKSGFCALPAYASKKCPPFSWKKYQNELPTEEDIKKWETAYKDVDAIAIICGKVSDGLEVLDFDFEAISFDAFRAEAEKRLKEKGIEGLLSCFTIETTQNGGKHLFYRVNGASVAKNDKLCTITKEELLKHPFERSQVAKKAAEAGNACTIETRGEGGLIIAAPSKGYTITQGKLNKYLTTIESKTAELLKAAARACGTVAQKSQIENPKKESNYQFETVQSSSFSSVDWLKNNPDFTINLLEKHGWQVVGNTREKNKVLFARPGIEDCWSSANYNKEEGYFYNYSTSAPLPSNVSISPCELLAALEFNGDTKAASNFILKNYGNKSDGLKQVTFKTANQVAEVPPDFNDFKEVEEDKTPAFPFNVSMDFKCGFLYEYVNKCKNATLSEEIEPLAFFGGFGALAHIVSNKIKWAQTFSNVYLITQAPSGTGKNIPITRNNRIFNYYDPESYTGKVESAQTLQALLVKNNQLCINQDEFGTYLKNANKGGGGFTSKIIELCTDIWNKSGEQVKTSSSLANRKRNNGAGVNALYVPYLSITAFSQPSQMVDFFTLENAKSGMTARYFTPIISQRMKRNAEATFNLDLTEKEKSIVDSWKAFLGNSPARVCCFTASASEKVEDKETDFKEFNQYEDKSAPKMEGVFEVPVLKEVKELYQVDLEKWDDLAYSLESKNPFLSSFYRRAGEYIKKIALIFAADKYGANRLTLCVDQDIYFKSLTLLEYFKDCLIYSIQVNAIEDAEQSAEAGKIKRDIERFKKKCVEAQNALPAREDGGFLVSASLVCIAFKDPKRRDNLLSTLTEGGVIAKNTELVKTGAKGRPFKYYVVYKERLERFLNN